MPPSPYPSHPRIAAALLASLLILAACSPEPPTPTPTPAPAATPAAAPATPPSPTPTQPPPAPTPAPPAAPSPTPDPDPRTPPQGTLRVAVTGAAPHWDLHAALSEWAALFGPGPSHARITRFTLGPEGAPSLDIACDLCSSWSFPNPLTFEFNLNPKALWQPLRPFEQRPVTPSDIAFSLERLRDPSSPHASLLHSVDSIQTLGDRAVRLSLRYPDPDLPLKLASPYAVIMNPHIIRTPNDARDAPVVGAGPWLFAQAASGQVTLSAWNDYPAPPRVETIEFLIASSQQVAADLLRQGKADAAHIPNQLWPELQAEGFRSAIVERQGRGVLLGFNAQRPPFDNHELRRAAIRSLDLRTALDATFGIGSVGSGLPVLNDEWRLTPNEIRSILQQPPTSPDGSPAPPLSPRDAPPFTLAVANFGEAHIAHGELLAQQLQTAGFNVQLNILNRATYLRQIWEERDFDAFVGPMPPVDAPNAFLLGLAHSQGASNITGGDPELDALINAVALELNPDARAQLARSLQILMLQRGYFVMAASAAERWALHPRIQEFPPDMPMGAGDLWARVRLADPSST